MNELSEQYQRDWAALRETREFWSRRAAAARRRDAEEVECPRCHASSGSACSAKPGVQMADGGYHLSRWHRWDAGW